MPLWRKLIVVLGVLWLVAAEVHAATDVGTTIVNQATLTYTDKSTGQLIELRSNTSTIKVGPLRQFELLAPITLTLLAGQSVALPHTLQNIGNVADRYALRVENQLADNADLINLLLYIDSNKNGAVDAGEPVVDNELLLEAGETVSLIITGIVPLESAGNDTIDVSLYAEAIGSELAIQSNTDTISVKPSSKLSVELQASRSCDVRSAAGDKIDFTFTAINQTNTLPDEKSLFIDGEQRSGILLELDVPEGLDLIPDQLLDIIAYQGIALVQADGAGEHWMRYEHWTGTTAINRFGLFVPNGSFAQNETVSVLVPTIVANATSNKKIELTGGIDFDNDGNRDLEFAPPCVNVVGRVAAVKSEIRFLEPNFALQRAEQTPEFAIDQNFVDAPVYRLNRTASNDSAAMPDRRALGDSAAGLDYKLSVNGVYVELRALVPNGQTIVDGVGVRYVPVILESALTGDYIQLLLRETQANSGVYRSLRPVLLSEEMAGDGAYCPGGTGALPSVPDFEDSNDICTLKSAIDDTLTVFFIDQNSAENISDTAVVDPVSRVFDSTSLLGVADAIVSIEKEGEVQSHPITDTPLILTTDQQGRYFVPRVLAGDDYSIRVQAPAAYVFPSSVNPEQFSADQVTGLSYGLAGFASGAAGTFSVVAGTAPPIIDIPLDPANRDALFLLEKSAETATVDIGDSLAYKIEIDNRSRGQLGDVAIIDYPAFGFRYVLGSATFNDQPVADPTRLTVPISSVDSESSSNDLINGLQFLLPQVEAQSKGVLRYHMRATAGASDGSGINRASANATTNSGLVLSTPTSVAKVTVERRGVLSDKAIVFGKVYVDSSCDNIQNKGEWPIGGVRLYLQDGTYVVTDEDGQFSLYGLNPGLHVLKLDNTTMPEGLILKPTDTRQAADPSSRFVELSNGDFHRADFASYCPQQNADAVFAELKQRNLILRDSWLLSEASRYDPSANSPATDVRKHADADGDISQSMLGYSRLQDDNRFAGVNGSSQFENAANGARVRGSNQAENLTNSTGVGSTSQVERASNATGVAQSAADENAQNDAALSVRANNKATMGDPKELVKSITAEQAAGGSWLWPQDDLSWDGRFMAVIKSGLDPQLYVNEVPVPHAQIGEQIINRREQAQLVAWYGVKLIPGLNHLQVKGKDAFGNERVLAAGTFRRPSAGVRLHLQTRQDTLEADGGRTSLPIDILVTDAQDNPANGVYFVTLRSTGGAFVEEDLQLREPGMQVRVENGRGQVHLRSTDETGNVRIQARTGSLDASVNVVQIAAARPLIGAGLVDIGGQWNRVNTGRDSRADLDEGFKPDARVALFLKGRIKNDIQMSLSYDSDKNKHVDLLRDINPNDYYATYGDSSLRGVEAQSRSKLYLKLEKDRNSVMWGDYLTDSNAEYNDLGRVQRTLTGVNTVLDNGTTRLQAFAAQESASRRSEEIRGNGTAMLYQLQRSPIEINSEVVERIVRDRDNLGLVIRAETLQRYSDYSIDFATGALRFADVVPTVDSELNPVFIRVSYDMNSGADEYLVSGIRLLHQVNSRLNVAASLTDDQNPISGYTLGSVSALAHLSLNTKLSASAAVQDHRLDNTRGDAQRVSIEHNWRGRRDYKTAMTWARASTQFDNPAAGIAKGREEWRVEHRQPVGNTVKAVAEATHSRSLSDVNENTTASLSFEKTFSNWSLKAGGRHIRSENESAKLSFNTILLGAQRRFSLRDGRRGSIGIDYEQDTSNKQRYRLGLSSRLQLHEHVSAYARYELDQGLSFQSYALDGSRNRTFTAGVESDILPSTKLYSEYRLRGNFSGQSMETASGIRGRYEIKPKLVVSPAFEIIDVIAGTTRDDSVALSLGVSDTRNANRKLNAQAEIRETSASRYFGFRGSVAQRLSVDWTGLIREEFTRQTPDVGELTSRHRFTLGFARRPKRSNEHHGLYMANWKLDYGPQDGQDRTSFILSTHQNRQITPNTNLSGRFGARWTNTEFASGTIRSQVMMGDLRASVDIHRRWELDLRGGWLGTGGANEGKYALGFGLSWIADRNMRLGLRYNVVGFREEDLDEQGYNTQGLRLGLQVKFDEDWFRWLE